MRGLLREGYTQHQLVECIHGEVRARKPRRHGGGQVSVCHRHDPQPFRFLRELLGLPQPGLRTIALQAQLGQRFRGERDLFRRLQQVHEGRVRGGQAGVQKVRQASLGPRCWLAEPPFLGFLSERARQRFRADEASLAERPWGQIVLRRARGPWHTGSEGSSAWCPRQVYRPGSVCGRLLGRDGKHQRRLDEVPQAVRGAPERYRRGLGKVP
mmetsp:Transcript_44172/g.122307  ORF Transcript_44172/g.122307 Transcript_44172/m.122307 type:complete len:212 (+) Transcript_44172:256-891(+)